jgi:hypothetical protein
VYPPINDGKHPHYLTYDDALNSKGKVFVELSLSQADDVAGYWYESHKLDLLCIHVESVDNDNESVSDRDHVKVRKCAPLNDESIRIPSLPRSGNYSMKAFLIGSQVEAVGEAHVMHATSSSSSSSTSSSSAAEAAESRRSRSSRLESIKFVDLDTGNELTQSGVRYFTVASKDPLDEVIPMEVNIDGVNEIVEWRPHVTKSVYEAAQEFCGSRLRLVVPQQLTSCMDTMVTTLLDLRRQGRGLHIR